MKLPRIELLATLLRKSRQLKAVITAPREYGPTPPRGPEHRPLRRQWLLVCIGLTFAINALMFAGLRWAYPSNDEMNFREEVSTLLSIQGYLVAQKPGDKIPSMDSIRDVMFGPKTTGAALRKRCVEMLAARQKINLDPVLANTVEESLKRWEKADETLARQQTMFVAGFLALSLGVPLVTFMMGLPAYARLYARVQRRRDEKQARRSSARAAAVGRAKDRMNLKRQQASNAAHNKP